MAETDTVFSGSIPDIYDQYLVPLIFSSYARDLAQRIATTGPRKVLETAAGSGVVTRELAPLLDGDAEYFVTDLNQPMLDRAKDQQPDDRRITWRQADALHLPFEGESFDVVCCQFGAMFFPDRAEGYREAFRTLREGGRFLFSVWDRIEHNEFADCVTRTACRVFPDNSPVFLARTPHGYHDVDQIRREVQAAGFRDIAIHTLTEKSTAQHARLPAIAYCQGTPLRNEIEARDPSAVENVTDMAALDIEKEFGSGPVSGKIQAHVIEATR